MQTKQKTSKPQKQSAAHKPRTKQANKLNARPKNHKQTSKQTLNAKPKIREQTSKSNHKCNKQTKQHMQTNLTPNLNTQS